MVGFRITVILFCSMVCGLGAAAPSEPCDAPSVTAQAETKAFVLSPTHIQAKRDAYVRVIEQIQTRRNIALGAVGVFGVAAGAYALHRWLKPKEKSLVDSETTAGASKINQAVFDQIQASVLKRLQQESTFAGKCSLILNNARDDLAKMFLLTVLMVPLNRVWGSISEKGLGLFSFDAEKKLAHAERIFLRDARFFYQSYMSFLKQSATGTAQMTDFAKQLADQVNHGVCTDFFALGYTLEHCFALMLACIEQDDAFDVDDKRALEQEVWEMCALFNQAAELLTFVIGLDADSRNEAYNNVFAAQLQELFGACERLIHSVGMRLFGKDFAL